MTGEMTVAKRVDVEKTRRELVSRAVQNIKVQARPLDTAPLCN